MSTDPDFSRKAADVQEAIKNHSADVWRLLQLEAVVFVCGEASHMAPDVRQAFAWVFQEHTTTTASPHEGSMAGKRNRFGFSMS